MSQYDEAMAEAYASADPDEIPLDTLELRHPGFVDPDTGNPVAIRVVRMLEDWTLCLEMDAPMDAGKYVLFTGCPFDFASPDWGQNQAPSIEISIANVSKKLMPYLEMAALYMDPIAVTYRPYLASDTSGPQLDPPIHMVMTKVDADVFTITGKMGAEDVHNFPFPSEKYIPARFKGLVR